MRDRRPLETREELFPVIRVGPLRHGCGLDVLPRLATHDLPEVRRPGGRLREEVEVERAITNAYEWAYSAYYHTAVVLGGELVR